MYIQTNLSGTVMSGGGGGGGGGGGEEMMCRVPPWNLVLTSLNFGFSIFSMKLF